MQLSSRERACACACTSETKRRKGLKGDLSALALQAESLLQIVTRSDSIGKLVHGSLKPRGICRPQLAQPVCFLQPDTSDRANSHLGHATIPQIATKGSSFNRRRCYSACARETQMSKDTSASPLAPPRMHQGRRT